MDAESRCREQQSHLSSIVTPEEQEFVNSESGGVSREESGRMGQGGRLSGAHGPGSQAAAGVGPGREGALQPEPPERTGKRRGVYGTKGPHSARDSPLPVTAPE